jgi:crossover junction endodeoxyribonuclease RusA
VKTFEFFAAGEPKGQPRPRACAFRIGGKYTARMYDAGTSDGWKASVIAAGAAHCPDAPLTGPISVCLTFYFPRPKSHFFTGKHAAVLRELAPNLHTTKPDSDNLAKVVLDAMTVAGWWKDDSQVTPLLVVKSYENENRKPGAQISVVILDA